MKLLNLPLGPVWIFLELCHENFILDRVFPQPFHLFVALSSMAYNNFGNSSFREFILFLISLLFLFHLWALQFCGTDTYRSWTITFLQFCKSLGIGNGSCMLLKGSFWSFEKESIYTLIEVFTRHIIVYYPKSANIDCVFPLLVYVISYFGQFTLLLNNLHWLTAAFVRSRFIFVRCLSLDDFWFHRFVKNWLLLSECQLSISERRWG